MKNNLFLILFFTMSYNLEAVKYSCVGESCQTEDLRFIDISDLNKRDVFTVLYTRACRDESKYNALGNKKNYGLQEADFRALEDIWGWDVEIWNGCQMWVKLSQNIVDVRIFNGLHGPNAAQKAIKKLRKQKVLLS